jgi:hypothetical protein
MTVRQLHRAHHRAHIRARRWVIGAVAAALITTCLAFNTTPANAETLPASVSSCTGVWVVVDRGNGETTTRCAITYGTGMQALRSAGFSVGDDDGFILQIQGFPTTPEPLSYINYWSYWHAAKNADGTFGSWSYSNLGANSYHPAKGSVEGWRFGDGGTIVPTVKPPRGYVKAPAPKLTGKAKKGRKLTVNTGTWSPKPGRISIKWYRNGKAIKTSAYRSYRLVKSDVGKRITVRVTASGTGLQTVTSVSKATKKVTR